MQRDIIKIDDEKCNGCGLCIPNCHEGALQIIDDKAVLLSDLLCDGLGACIGHCPTGALTIEKREASPYDEIAVITDMVKKGKNVVIAHLKHLKDHQEIEYYNIGMDFLKQNRTTINFNIDEVIDALEETKKIKITEMTPEHNHGHGGGCPGSRSMVFNAPVAKTENEKIEQNSELTHWPIQLHLVQPAAAYFKRCDLLVAADCTAFAIGNFHSDFLKGRKVVIACPKLDANKEVYIEKFTRFIDDAQVNTITVMIMEVPCCAGLLQMVQIAQSKAKRKVPVKMILVGLQGEVLQEEWV
jgi:Fe-S-cluster-containing hydrogenase component 2